jgi:hypothetical protein
MAAKRAQKIQETVADGFVNLIEMIIVFILLPRQRHIIYGTYGVQQDEEELSFIDLFGSMLLAC